MAMDWLKKILEGAAITDGALDVDALEKAISKEMPKHTVPKSTYDDMKSKFEDAQGRLDGFSDVDIVQLQADLEAERAGRVKDKQDYQLRSVLEKAGAADVDYLAYKLAGTAKYDKDGKLEDADNLVKSAKETHRALFPQEQGYSPTGGNGAAAANPWKKETFNLTQQGQIFKDNPAQAKEMMAAAGITQE